MSKKAKNLKNSPLSEILTSLLPGSGSVLLTLKSDNTLIVDLANCSKVEAMGILHLALTVSSYEFLDYQKSMQ